MPGLFPAQARGPGSEDAESAQPLHSSQPHALGMQPHNTDQEAVRAPQDATIAAIGFVAVLIVNVAYVGVPRQTVSAR